MFAVDNVLDEFYVVDTIIVCSVCEIQARSWPAW